MFSIANLVKAFKTSLDTFLLNNFIMIWPLSPARWQSSMSGCPCQTLQHHPSLHAKNILEIFVTDWQWYARVLRTLFPEILDIFLNLFFNSLQSLDEWSRPEPLASTGIGGFKKSSPGTLRSSINDTFWTQLNFWTPFKAKIFFLPYLAPAFDEYRMFLIRNFFYFNL